MSNVYGLTRVSTDGQAKSGLGLAAMKRAVEQYHRQHLRKHRLAKIYADKAVSARRVPLLSRPEGGKLDQVLASGDHVIVPKLDRAFRSLKDFAAVFERWKKRGVSMHFLDLGVDTSTPVGELVAGIMASVAQWESSRIGERIRDAKGVLKRLGRTTNGRALLGMLIRRKKLVPDPAQRKTMRLIVELRRNNHLSWPKIAAALNARKVRRPDTSRQRKGEGAAWTAQAVWRAYHRELELRNPGIDREKRRRRQCPA